MRLVSHRHKYKHKHKQQTPPPQPEPEQGTPEQQKRLADLYKDFEHIDEDVAAEFDSKMIAPIRAELNELRAYRKQEQERQQKALVTNSNNTIFAKHKKAEKILQSQQFKDFLNADRDPIFGWYWVWPTYVRILCWGRRVCSA